MAFQIDTSNSNEATKALAQCLDRLELTPRAYSGRGMFGSHCIAFTIGRDSDWSDFSVLMHLGAELTRYAAEQDADLDADDAASCAADWIRQLGDVSVDQLGFDKILYWQQARVERSTNQIAESEDD